MNRHLLVTPRARFITEPFVNGYTDIEKENAIFAYILNANNTENNYLKRCAIF